MKSRFTISERWIRTKCAGSSFLSRLSSVSRASRRCPPVNMCLTYSARRASTNEPAHGWDGSWTALFEPVLYGAVHTCHESPKASIASGPLFTLVSACSVFFWRHSGDSQLLLHNSLTSDRPGRGDARGDRNLSPPRSWCTTIVRLVYPERETFLIAQIPPRTPQGHRSGLNE
jgi:hypothetical protein